MLDFGGRPYKGFGVFGPSVAYPYIAQYILPQIYLVSLYPKQVVIRVILAIYSSVHVFGKFYIMPPLKHNRGNFPVI